MNKHNIIRSLAIILAIFLIIGIFNLFFHTIKFFMILFKDERVSDHIEKDYTIITENNENNEKIKSTNNLNKISKISLDNKTRIYINLNVTKLELKTGDELILKSDNPYLKIIEKDDTLKIIDETKNNFNKRKDLYKLEIQIPDKIYNELNINTGVSKIAIEDITLENLILELGVGEAELEDIRVLKNTNIKMGVGTCDIEGILHGNTKIEGGVGALKIDLEDNMENYSFKIEKGLGKVEINDETIKNNNKKIGNGSNLIKIEGGIGEILVEVED